MGENPVVPDEETARSYKMQVDRAKLCIRDLEDERDGKVRPLNNEVAAINFTYRAPRRSLGGLLDEMLRRLQDFVVAEEKRRAKIAMEAAAAAREAERKAKEAEEIERNALANAENGELGIDVADVQSRADQAFEGFEKAQRAAIRAQAEAHVKVGGGFSRAISMKTKEVWAVNDFVAAVSELGLTSSINDAIIKSAKAFRQINNRLPNGVSVSHEREL